MRRKEPRYCLHKGTGQAYMRIEGRMVYLGEYNSPKSLERYNRLKAEWLLNRFSPKLKQKATTGPCMADLCNAYLDFAEKYYSQSSEAKQMKLACKPVSELYATMLCSEFGIREYKTCRQWWVNRGCSRQYTNHQTKRLLRILRWGVENEMVPSRVVEALRCVAPLKAGRCEAPETKRILPVEQARVDATLPHCSQVVGDMIRFQQLVGCRPGEVCQITPSMVDRSGDVWLIALAKHKTAYRGKDRILYVGPKAQAILSKYLLRAADSNCFSPIESERQRLQERHAARKTPLSCGNRPGTNRTRRPKKSPGEAFTTGTYGRSIKNACRRAFPAPKELSKEGSQTWHSEHSWHPNQLRHSRATELRRQFGIEGAQVILGHSDVGVTQVYAERDAAKAIDIARRIG